MVDKRTDHVFESYDGIIELTEFPHDGGDELHVELKPNQPLKYVSLFGNPEGDQTLCFRAGDLHIWLKSDDKLFPLLEETIAEYRRTWAEHYQSSEQKVNENGN